jgi:hypothetical protein
MGGLEGAGVLVPQQMTRFALGGAAYYEHEFDRVGAEELASGDHPAR